MEGKLSLTYCDCKRKSNYEQ